MNKQELIAYVAATTELNKATSEKVVNSIFSAITKSLKSGKPARFVRFGTFKVTKTKARMGRNPHTQQPLKIPASKRVRFSSSKAIKEAVNS